MKINPRIQELIAAKVTAEAENRAPSGRLSASKLGWPLQWQMLNWLKVPQASLDEYTLRKFQRGKDVEDRIMVWLAPSQESMQVKVHYKGINGIADVILEYPIEVKSVTNRAFKYKMKDGPTRSHRAQAELYAKALNYDTFGIAYVASDDYRVLCFEEPVTGLVDEIIDRYDAQKLLAVVPEFNPEETWQAIPDYNPYPEWQALSAEEIEEKLNAMGVVVPGGSKKRTKKLPL